MHDAIARTFPENSDREMIRFPPDPDPDPVPDWPDPYNQDPYFPYPYEQT